VKLGLGRPALFARVFLLVNLLLLVVAILAVYEMQIADDNAYLGYRHVGTDPQQLLLLVASVLVAGALLPVEIRRPSDFLSLFHILFVVLPYVALFPIGGPVAAAQYWLNFATLLVPLLVVRLGTASAIGLRMPSPMSYGSLELAIVALCVLGTAYAFLHAPSSAGIDLASTYDRRIEGREIFQAGTPAAYLNAAIVNGFAPTAAFLGGWRRRNWLLFVALASGAAFYYVIGLKAPIFYVGLAYLVGYAIRMGAVGRFVAVLLGLLWLALLAAFVEYVASGYSYVADYFLRRVFAVPSFLMAAYFEFMFQDPFSGWRPELGFHAAEGITYFVGAAYLGVSGANANTNAFLYQLAAGGLPGYLVTTLLVSGVFAYLDAAYRAGRNAGFAFLGFLYAALLVEQAATTALASSGIGALILLVSLTRARGRPHDSSNANRSIAGNRPAGSATCATPGNLTQGG